MRQATLAAIGIVLIVGVIGVLATLLAYVLGALLMLALFGLLMRGMMTINEKHAAKREVEAATQVAAQRAAEEFERSLRHPAWEAAITVRRDQRQRLVRQYVDLEQRVTQLRAGSVGMSLWSGEKERLGMLEQEMTPIRDLMRQTFGRVPNRFRATQLDVEPPRNEVIHLDREFMLTGDCRYGHWDEHAIDDSGNGRVLRRCTYCEPNTRWTERV